jgi:hypothetical protein
MRRPALHVLWLAGDCELLELREEPDARKERAAAERGVADVVALAVTRSANRESLMF